MRRRRAFAVVISFVLAALAGPVAAQDEPKPRVPEPAPPAAVRKAPTLLRVQMTISRYQGETKVASASYTMLVTTDGKNVQVRMGVEVPISVTSFPVSSVTSAPVSPDKYVPVTTFQYKNVGTNIDCRAEGSGDGQFQLLLAVESSSIYTTSGDRTLGGQVEPGVVSDRPLFRTFNVNLNPTLRDGQSIQVVASTDPVTGEVVKIDVSLNVVK